MARGFQKPVDVQHEDGIGVSRGRDGNRQDPTQVRMELRELVILADVVLTPAVLPDRTNRFATFEGTTSAPAPHAHFNRSLDFAIHMTARVLHHSEARRVREAGEQI